MAAINYLYIENCRITDLTGLEEAVNLIKKETRHFAKRQLTWFRRERDVIWFDKSKYSYDERMILEDMCKLLEEKQII